MVAPSQNGIFVPKQSFLTTSRALLKIQILNATPLLEKKVGFLEVPLNWKGSDSINITTIGIDLAKSVFQLHGVDKNSVRWVEQNSPINKLPRLQNIHLTR